MRELAIVLAARLLSSLWGFNAPTDEAGGVKVTISEIGEIRQLGAPVAVRVTVRNEGADEARGRVRMQVIDDWVVQGLNPQAFAVDGGQEQALEFAVVPGAHSYAAHYPIHAWAEYTVAGKSYVAHPILIVKVADSVGYHEPWADPPQEPLVVPPRGAVQLERHRRWRVGFQTHGQEARIMPWGWMGSDPDTGTVLGVQRVERGGSKSCLNMHEPWRKGWGVMWVDIPVRLPKAPCRLVFWTAIRDHVPDREPPSDGVDFRVQVAPAGSESFAELFRRFSDSKRWEGAEVDLSAYQGQQITLRLWQGPGPKNDTTCDSAFWGEPTILSGGQGESVALATSPATRQRALELARGVLSGRRGKYSWLLESAAGQLGAAFVPGPRLGIVDGALAFASRTRALVFDGFQVAVDDSQLGDWRSEAAVTHWEAKETKGDGVVMRYEVVQGGRRYTVEAQVWAERGALRVAFSMPGVQRRPDGTPRFTHLALGRASEPVRRLYAGFGNVMEPKGPVTVWASGFQLSSRHAGADFVGGLSLLQASDVYPDRFEWEPAEQRCSLVTHHDATLTLVPSERGAFAAARVFRDVAGYRPGAGVKKLLGRMCIDWWGADYAQEARELRRAAAYGVTDAVYVKHNWQCWGYDYRLPDIYPPGEYGGTVEEFRALAEACRQAGILFAPHDNYIDFYPDAEGFSYRYIIFTAQGRPEPAWYHAGRQAQSYRWLPHAFMPWLERNLKLLRDSFAPTAYFIDVFSAAPPLDYYDQAGRFYTKVQCAEEWGRAFDRVREILGGDAPTISEAGHDGLVGHLDAGEADHLSAEAWSENLSDYERCPWQDMVTHGSFVLLAGGLGPRYAGSKDNETHGYGSDDYLSNTVLGGRNPMCDGPCFRRTVMTYWLLHDVCARLARASLESHEFVGDNIHRQHTRFAGGGEVWSNRGPEPWRVEGVTLPQYGFLARAGDCEAQIALRDGIAARMASAPGVLFVDARPVAMDTAWRGPVKTRVLGGRVEGRRVIIDVEWEILEPLPEGEVIFVHVCHPESQQPERIVYQPPCDLPVTRLQEVGRHEAHIVFEVPPDAKGGEYFVRYGLYNPKRGGRRLVPLGEADGSRMVGGTITVRREGDRIVEVSYAPPAPQPSSPQLNAEGRMVDFGPLATNGAFRLLYQGQQWWLIPLPGSLPFAVELRVDKLGAPGKRVLAVEPLDMMGAAVTEEVEVAQEGPVCRLRLPAKAFRYRLLVG
jgi:hypothetical protein